MPPETAAPANPLDQFLGSKKNPEMFAPPPPSTATNPLDNFLGTPNIKPPAPQNPLDQHLTGVMAKSAGAAPSGGEAFPSTGSAAGDVWGWMNRPLLTLPKPSEEFVAQHPYVSAVTRGAEGVAEGLTTPLSIGLILATGGLGGLAEGGLAAAEGGTEAAEALAGAARGGGGLLSKLTGGVGGKLTAAEISGGANLFDKIAAAKGPQFAEKTFQMAKWAARAANAGFTGQMIYGVSQQVPQIQDRLAVMADDKATPEQKEQASVEALQLATEAVMGSTMAVMSGRHLAHTFPGGEANGGPTIAQWQRVQAAHDQPAQSYANRARSFEADNRALAQNPAMNVAARLWGQAGEDSAKLEEWRKIVANDKAIRPQIREKWDGLLQQAQNLPENVKQLTRSLREPYDTMYNRLVEMGKLPAEVVDPETGEKRFPKRENYFGQMEYFPGDEHASDLKPSGIRSTKSPGFTKKAYFDDPIEALQNGYEMKDGLVQAHGAYLRRFGSLEGVMAAEQQMLSLKNADGTPFAVAPGSTRIVNGKVTVALPKGFDVTAAKFTPTGEPTFGPAVTGEPYPDTVARLNPVNGQEKITSAPVDEAEYRNALDRNPSAATLTDATEEQLKGYSKYRLMVDGKPLDAYYSISPSGELVGVVNNTGRGGLGMHIMPEAIDKGARWLSAWDVNGRLPRFYRAYGFEPVKSESYNVAEYGEPSQPLKDAWKESGWKEGDPYPSVQHMEYRPEPDALARRTGYKSPEDLVDEYGTVPTISNAGWVLPDGRRIPLVGQHHEMVSTAPETAGMRERFIQDTDTMRVRRRVGRGGQEYVFSKNANGFTPEQMDAIVEAGKTIPNGNIFIETLNKEGNPGKVQIVENPTPEKLQAAVEKLGGVQQPTPEHILGQIRSGKNFAILQAENPNNARISDAENAARTKALEADLRKAGYHPTPVEGNTKDVAGQKEHAFYVPGIPAEESTRFGRQYGQAGILTHEGLHWLDRDVVNPSDNAKVQTGDAARDNDYFTVLKGAKGEEIPFNVPIDFSREVRPFSGQEPDAVASRRTPAGSTVPLLKKPLTVEGRPTVAKVARALQDFTTEKSQLNALDLASSSPEEMIGRARAIGAHELYKQLGEENSGKGWYAGDVNRFHQAMSQIYPELADNPQAQRWFNALTAAASLGNDSPSTIAIVDEMYRQWKETGKVPVQRPDGTDWPAEHSNANRSVLQNLQKILDHNGGDWRKTTEWLLSKHPVSELNAVRQRVTKIPGKASDLKYGSEAMSAKSGPFHLNLSGIATEFTMDKWATRTWNRWMGTLVNPDGSVNEGPTPAQRVVAKQAFEELAKKFKLQVNEAQAVMWFYEQKLYANHGVNIDQGVSYGDAAEDYVRGNVRPQENGVSGQEAAGRGENALDGRVRTAGGEGAGEVPSDGDTSFNPEELASRAAPVPGKRLVHLMDSATSSVSNPAETGGLMTLDLNAAGRDLISDVLNYHNQWDGVNVSSGKLARAAEILEVMKKTKDSPQIQGLIQNIRAAAEHNGDAGVLMRLTGLSPERAQSALDEELWHAGQRAAGQGRWTVHTPEVQAAVADNPLEIKASQALQAAGYPDHGLTTMLEVEAKFLAGDHAGIGLTPEEGAQLMFDHWQALMKAHPEGITSPNEHAQRYAAAMKKVAEAHAERIKQIESTQNQLQRPEAGRPVGQLPQPGTAGGDAGTGQSEDTGTAVAGTSLVRAGTTEVGGVRRPASVLISPEKFRAGYRPPPVDPSQYKQLAQAVYNELEQRYVNEHAARGIEMGTRARTGAMHSDFDGQLLRWGVPFDKIQELRDQVLPSGMRGDAIQGESGAVASRPARPDEGAVAPTETPEFKRWFATSKVVDGNTGKPKVVYHGTTESFTRFRRGDEGIFFTENPENASTYAGGVPEDEAYEGGFPRGANIIPVHLRIQKPLTVHPMEYLNGETKAGRSLHPTSVKRGGYDGLRITSEPDLDQLWDGDTWVAFHPTQVKSATGNNGAFDVSNPDVLASRSPVNGQPDNKDPRILADEKGRLRLDVSDYRPGPDLFNRMKVKAIDQDGKPVYERQNLLIHPDNLKDVNRSFADTSWFRQNPIMSGLLNVSGQAKRSLLSFFSPFHFNTEFLRGIQMGASVREALHPGPLTQDRLVFNTKFAPKIVDPASKSLYAEGVAQNTPLVHKIPWIGKGMEAFENKLFGDYIPRLKADSFDRVVKQLGDRNPSWTQDQVHFAASKIVDAAFGGINWKQLGVSMNSQDLARLVMLAPDFTSSQVLFAKYGLDPGGSVVRQSFGRIALYNFGVARLLNLLTTQKLHLEHPFGVVSPDNKKVWSIRTMPDDILHGLTDPRGFIYNRLNPLVARTGWETLTGRDQRGKAVTANQQVLDLLKNVTPIGAQNFVPAFKRPDETKTEGLLRAVGLNAQPNQTVAQKNAAIAASNHSESGPVDPAQLEHHQKIMQLEDAIRTKQVPFSSLNAAYVAGGISQVDAKAIQTNIKETQGMSDQMAHLYTQSARLPLPEFLSQVWAFATPPEKTSLLPLLMKKKALYVKGAMQKLTPQQRINDPTMKQILKMSPNEGVF